MSGKFVLKTRLPLRLCVGLLFAASLLPIGLNATVGPVHTRIAVQSSFAPALVLNTGHFGFTQISALSDDGSLLATGGGDTLVKVWSTKTRGLLRTLNHPGHAFTGFIFVTGLDFSRDGSYLAASYADGAVKLWEVGSGRIVQEVSLKMAATTIRLSNDGRWLAFGSEDRRARLWDLVNKREVELSGRHARTVNAVAFSRDGRWLASGSANDGEVKVWECATGSLLTTLTFKKPEGGEPMANAGEREATAPGEGEDESPEEEDEEEEEEDTTDAADGLVLGFGARNLIAAAKTDDNTLAVRQWEAGSWSERESRTAHAYLGDALLFSHDGEWLLTKTGNRQIKRWAIDPWQELPPLTEPSVSMWQLSSGSSLSLSGNKLLLADTSSPLDRSASAAGGGTGNRNVLLWDVKSGRVTGSVSAPIDAVSDVSVSPDGRSIVTLGGGIKIWDAGRDYVPRDMPVEGRTYLPSFTAALSRDGSLLATKLFEATYSQSTIGIFDIQTGRQQRPPLKFDYTVDTLVFSPDKRWLVSTGRALVGQYQAHVTDLTNGRTHDLNATSGLEALSDAKLVSLATFNHDSSRLLALRLASPAKSLELWDTATWTKVEPPIRPRNTIHTMAYSPDGRYVAGVEAGILKVWQASDWVEVWSTPAKSFSVTFSEDGNLLAVADINLEIKIYDLSRRTPPRALMGHTGSVSRIVFNGTGTRLISSSTDGTARVWDAQTGGLLISLVSLRGGRDWLAITPKGLFDGSVGAMREVGWRFDESENETHPLDLFFNDFYYPGLTSEIMAGARPEPKIDLATEWRFPGLRTMFQQGLVSVRNVPGGKRLCLSAAALSGGNETATHVAACGDEPGLDITSLTLNPADAACTYSRNLLPHESAAVERIGKNPAPPFRTLWDGTETPVHSSTLHVLTVGVDKYIPREVSGPGALSLSVAGARAVRSFFAAQKQNGSPFGAVRLWDALFDTAATGAAIRNRIDEMAKEVEADDVVFIFMSGHGVVPGGQQMFYFAPVDMRRLCLSEARVRGVDSATLADLVRNLPARRIVLVVDACQSGGVVESLVRVGEAKVKQETRRDALAASAGAEGSRPPGQSGVGFYIIVAATPLQAGWQQAPDQLQAGRIGNGPMVQSLLDALADASGAPDGMVRMRKLTDRFEERLRRHAGGIGATQTPLIVTMGTDFPIAATPR